MSDDYYAVLGVERDSDERVLKKAYRKLPRSVTPTEIRVTKPLRLVSNW